ncbi:MAG: HPr family phosphocarrier protein [Clostridia bacterium]|nr:HPr family phosphocarrier protein [Clostridia bacterium]
MRSFSYTVKDEVGIHARPAGLIAKKAKEYESAVTIEKDGRAVKATGLVAIMGLAVKKGDTVTVRVEGRDEDEAADALERLLREIL